MSTLNLAPSGLLAKESNSTNGIALKYHEPPEAKRPRFGWRMYVYKNGKEIGTSRIGPRSPQTCLFSVSSRVTSSDAIAWWQISLSSIRHAPSSMR